LRHGDDHIGAPEAETRDQLHALRDIGDLLADQILAGDAEMANVDPMLQTAHYELGAIALEQDRADEAIDQLLKALAIKRTDADAMNLLGAAYVKAGTPEKAVEPLRRAILFVPIGWGERQPYHPWRSVNFLTDKTQRDPFSDQTNLKSLLCRVRPV